jgi:hypothetical protein
MRKLLLAAVCAMAWPAVGGATPLCISGSLNDYLALGPDGCSVGGVTFTNFSSAASLAGGPQIADTDVLVTPTVAAGQSQLAFGVTAAPGGPGPLLGILIGFAATAPSIGRADLQMSGASATGDGVVTAVEDLCLGATFAPVLLCPTVMETLIALQIADDAQLTDSRLLMPAQSFFDVFVDITLDNGVAGTAVLDGTVVTGFTRSVPEPTSWLLVGSGLAGLWARRRYRARADA